MKISIIVAASTNNVIGRNNQLPWHIPEDLAHFKKITMGKPILMGRRTHESIGRPLAGRQNIVLTRQRGYIASGCDVAISVEQALKLAKDCDEVMVIGGSKLYKYTLPIADQIYLTRVCAEFQGDTFFPPIDPMLWEIVGEERHRSAGQDQLDIEFVSLRRS